MLQVIFNGLAVGTTYALLALSVTLIFGLARVVHFAIADIAVATAFIMAFVFEVSSSWTLAALVGLLASLTLGFITDRGVFRFTRSKPIIGFLASLALIFIIRAAIGAIFGVGGKTLQPPLSGSFEMGSVLVRYQTITNMVLAIVLMILLYFLIEKTLFGLSLRAVADSPTGAKLMGVKVVWTTSLAFLITGVLIAGVSWIMLTSGAISTTTANAYLLKGFAAALIGGLGSLYGAVIAGLFVGLVEAFAVGYGPEGWTTVFIFGAVIVILLYKPDGLGRSSSRAAQEVHV